VIVIIVQAFDKIFCSHAANFQKAIPSHDGEYMLERASLPQHPTTVQNMHPDLTIITELSRTCRIHTALIQFKTVQWLGSAFFVMLYFDIYVEIA
jgi:hypothetical protein